MKMSYLQPKRWLVLFTILAILGSNMPLTAMAANDVTRSREGIVKSNIIKGNFRQGEVLVKFKKDRVDVSRFFGRLSVKSFANSNNLERKEILEPQNLTLMESETGETTEQLIARLKNDPLVEYVQPNYQYYPLEIPTNDTLRDQLWALENTGQTVNGTTGSNNADINGKEALDISTGSNVIVAVIDTGVAYNHPDLSANMWDGTNCKDENGNFLGGCNYGYDFEDDDKIPLPTDSSHGTHIAGTIAAAMNNGKGIIGVAPQAKIMALKSALTTMENVTAINFAKQNGAKVINASWGCYVLPDQGGIHADCSGSANYGDQALIDAISGFSGLFVTAAGNGDGDDDLDDGDNHDSGQTLHSYPCDLTLPNIICVAATDQNDGLASFSDFGATSVDVGAPGVNILSTIADSIALSENFDNVTTPNLPSGWTNTGDWGTYNFSGDKVLYGDYSHVPYIDNANSLATSPTVNLGNSLEATIGFKAKCDTEYTTTDWFDYMALEVSSDGDNFAEIIRWDEALLDILNGDSNPDGSASYDFNDFPIPNQYLSSNFKFRFRWFTNALNDPILNYDGCYVDNLLITKFSDGSDELYDYYRGTSMATPHVVGAAASVWGYNPSLTAAQVKSVVETTGDVKASLVNKTVTGKRINLFSALNIFQPVGGFDVADVIPSGQVTQSILGDGVVTVNFRLKDGMAGLPMVLKDFEYSVDGGAVFQAPSNGDASLALSPNWNNNNYLSSTDFSGTVFSFTINTKHADLVGLDPVDQSDVIIRFKANDGAKDSVEVTSEQFRVNNVIPTATLTNTPANPTILKTTDITVGGTGIVTYKYSLDGGALGGDIAVATNIQLADLLDGAHTIAVFGKDEQGNTQVDGTTHAWLIDSTGPTGTITNASGNPTNDRTPRLDLTIADDGVGIAGALMRFSCDGLTLTDFEPFANSKENFDLRSELYGCADADGTKTVYVQFQDSLGNVGLTVTTGEFVLNTQGALAQFTQTPANPTNQTSATFTVGGLDIVAYKYRLDGGGYSEEIPIITPINLAGLLEGTHTMDAIGKNSAGTWQDEAAPTSFSWIIDLTPPDVTGLSDDAVVTQSKTWDWDSSDPEAKFRFVVDQDISGVPTGLYDDVKTTTQAVGDGTFYLHVQTKDTAGNESAVTTVFAILDNTSPDITGISDDLAPTQNKVWNWDSSDPEALFRFLVDQNPLGAPEGTYGSEKTASQNGGDGTYYIHVQSIDALGNTSAVITAGALLDNTAPAEVTLSGLPPNPSNQTQTDITVGGTDVTHYKAKLDGGIFGAETPVSTHLEFLGLENGDHTLEVIGRDSAGNYQSEGDAATYSWTIDTSIIIALLTGAPPSITKDTSATITVSGEGVASYRFKLDGGIYGLDTPISEKIILNGLGDGIHTVEVLGKNAIGTEQDGNTPTTVSWTVDTTPPTAVLSTLPANPTTTTTANITVGGEGVTEYAYMLDGGTYSDFTPVAIQILLSDLSLSNHKLSVIGKDVVGNEQTPDNATTYSWDIVPNGGGGGGGGGSGGSRLVIPTPSVLGAQEVTRFQDGTVLKQEGRKQFYIVVNNKKRPVSQYLLLAKYAESEGIELDQDILEELPLMSAEEIKLFMENIFSVIPSPIPPAFPDVDPMDPEFLAIHILKTTGVIEGYPDGNFRPKNTVTRAEFLKVLMESTYSDIPKNTGACGFSDITGNEWFARFVCFAKTLGVTMGYPDGTFRPGQPVNIVEALAFMARANEWIIQEDDVNEWFKPYFTQASARKLIPNPDKTFTDPLTREETADLLVRLIMEYENSLEIYLERFDGYSVLAQASVLSIPQEEKYIEVLYLSVRIRDGIGYNSNIINGVKIGQKFPYIQEKDGWFQIILPDGSTGWIEGKWVKTLMET